MDVFKFQVNGEIPTALVPPGTTTTAAETEDSAAAAAPPLEQKDQEQNQEAPPPVPTEDIRTLEHNQELLLPLSDHVFIVHNEVQRASCVLYFLQCGTNTPAAAAAVGLFHLVARVSLVRTMKNVVALGYVVGCDVRRMNGNLGFRIAVESQYPLPTVHSTIEKAIDDLEKEVFETLDDETLETYKAAVANGKTESRERARERAASLWKEILDSTYDFRRDERELAALKLITTDKLAGFYRDYVKAGGRRRRCAVISIGPDRVLNRLEDRECLEFGSPEAARLLSRCPAMPPAAAGEERLAEWCQAVFSAKDNEYKPPLRRRQEQDGDADADDDDEEELL